MSCCLCDPRKKSMTSVVIWQGFLLLSVLTWYCSAFNLDARYPKVIQSTPNSYFGYSVGFWNGPNGYEVLVGSPKAKSGSLVTGGLYQCVIESGACTQIDVEQGSISDASRADQWLGVSLDVNPMNESLVTVCAHRAKFNITFKDVNGSKTKALINGICYQLKNGKKFKTIKKVNSKLGHNLLGMSVQYAKRSRILTIGLPGKRSFRGGYYQEMYFGSEFSNIGVSQTYVYSGYCVAILNNRSVIGMPRYEQYGGIWYNDQKITYRSKYAFGSYFGSSLAAVDLNSDGKEDLLVGSPYYSEKFVEEGRVYIYFYSYYKLEETPRIILSVPTDRGQFGKALATGDFNNDSYPDVIVAAPYENDGSGTIYLFSGHRFGIDKTFTQKIQGKDLQHNIQSFGISFSRTADIDSNGYQDIAVGAYLSDKVFVVYGRPIVKIKGSLTAKPSVLTSWQDNLNVSTLLEVKINLGKMYTMTFNIHLKTDTKRNPARTSLINGQKELIDTLEINHFFRKEYLVTIKNMVDIMEPINFTFTYQLKDEGYSSACSNTCPIAKGGIFTEQVKFDIGCGLDETCHTYLKVSIEKKRRRLILGRHKKFVLWAKVENTGENAYNAKARIFFSKFLEFESVNQTSDSQVKCHQEGDEELSCNLGHPLKEKSSVSFEVIFSIHSRNPKEDSIHIVMNATTISIVPAENVNNTQDLWVPMYFESKLEATGLSLPDTYVFRSSTTWSLNIMHQYELRNYGPSDASDVRFYVLIPHAIFQDIPLITKLKHEVIREDGKVFNDTCHLKPYTETNEDFKATMQHLRHNGDIFNCTGFKCFNMSCELDKIQKNDPVIKVQISFEIPNTLLKWFQGQIRNLEIVTTGTLTQKHNYRLRRIHTDHTKAKTTIIINRLPAKLKWWVVICSIAVGLLILLIFCILLWHCGYFQRLRVNKKQMKQEQAKEERSLLEHDQGRRPSQKIYTRQRISESEEIPEID